MNLEEIFKCKNISKSSLDLYKTKLTILNDNKPIKNLNFLYDIDKINEKIKGLKNNTKRSYIISIASILKCVINGENKPSKKLKTLYENYSKLLDEYNKDLKDQTEENTDVISIDKIKDIYDKLSKNKDQSKQSNQDYLILSFYYLIPARRNKDYALMKYTNNYKEELPKEFNYYDGNKFYFNNYKTKGTYNQQIIEVPQELKSIIDDYIKKNNINDNDFILTNLRTGKPLISNNAITIILNRIFGDRIGSSALRRSYLTNKYSDVEKELKEDTEAMGTSIETAKNNYIKKRTKSTSKNA
jgi:hypothetical protein